MSLSIAANFILHVSSVAALKNIKDHIILLVVRPELKSRDVRIKKKVNYTTDYKYIKIQIYCFFKSLACNFTSKT